jgi:hypothetical protein
MPLESRLRRELRREAERIEPDVGRSLSAVEARARGRRSTGLGSMLAAAAAVVIIVAGVQALRSSPDPGGPGGSPSPTQLASPSANSTGLVGSYHATLEESDGGAEFRDVAGEWTMDLGPDGVMLMAPPATFREGSTPQSGVAYAIDGEQFRTNLFQQLCDSIGVYDWLLNGGTLGLTPVDDDCALRRAVLGSTPWTRQ